jgi:hypothetical protein
MIHGYAAEKRSFITKKANHVLIKDRKHRRVFW